MGHWGMRSHRRTGHFGTLGHEVSQEDGTFWDTGASGLTGGGGEGERRALKSNKPTLKGGEKYKYIPPKLTNY